MKRAIFLLAILLLLAVLAPISARDARSSAGEDTYDIFIAGSMTIPTESHGVLYFVVEKGGFPVPYMRLHVKQSADVLYPDYGASWDIQTNADGVARMDVIASCYVCNRSIDLTFSVSIDGVPDENVHLHERNLTVILEKEFTQICVSDFNYSSFYRDFIEGVPVDISLYCESHGRNISVYFLNSDGDILYNATQYTNSAAASFIISTENAPEEGLHWVEFCVDNETGNILSVPLFVYSKKMSVEVETAPSKIYAGHPVMVTVKVMDGETGEPVEGAYVNMSTGGEQYSDCSYPYFQNYIFGYTDSSGTFTATIQTHPEDRHYRVDVSVNKGDCMPAHNHVEGHLHYFNEHYANIAHALMYSCIILYVIMVALFLAVLMSYQVKR